MFRLRWLTKNYESSQLVKFPYSSYKTLPTEDLISDLRCATLKTESSLLVERCRDLLINILSLFTYCVSLFLAGRLNDILLIQRHLLHFMFVAYFHVNYLIPDI